MKCDQCDSTEVHKQWMKDMKFHIVCDNCGNIISTGRQCDRCDRTDAHVFVQVIKDVFPNDYNRKRRTKRYKIRRCDQCATRIPSAWKRHRDQHGKLTEP